MASVRLHRTTSAAGSSSSSSKTTSIGMTGLPSVSASMSMPASMSGVPSNHNNNNNNNTSSWRIRDMAVALPRSRQVLDPSSMTTTTMTTTMTTMMMMELTPHASTHFDVDTCLARLRRDKAAVVRTAFEVAASSILETMDKADQEEEELESESELESVPDEDLPAALQDIPRLEQLRNASMERAHDNKEVAKRKPTSTSAVVSLSTSSSALTATTTTTTTTMTPTMAMAMATTMMTPTMAMTTAQSSPVAVTSSDTAMTAHTTTYTTTLTATTAKTTMTTAKTSGGTSKPTTKDINKKAETTPKFTRNTPASSAASLDARLTSSRAILCTAANVAFGSLTPPLPGLEVDVADVPQNPNNEASKSSVSNMGAVVVEAQTLGQRIESVATSAARRSARRYQYRKDNLQYDKSPTSVLQVRNPFAWNDDTEDEEDLAHGSEESQHVYHPQEEALTEAWSQTCLPRFVSVLQTGVGHAVYHDMEWKSRHGRIANLLQELAHQDSNFGPHLIVTIEPDVERFAKEFRASNSHLRLLSTVHTDSLRALPYAGTSEQRKGLRKQFPDATGLAEAPFHVIISSYAHFLQDYLHFCQMPFEVVIMDDGTSWMAAAQADPNSPLGTLWEAALFSKNDHQMGLAGVTPTNWDYGAEEFDDETITKAWIGLTARHRVLTSSTIKVQQRTTADPLPITGLVNFVAPHFADAVREEWDRSRISNDSASMKHFRKLLTRSVIVHAPQLPDQDMHQLALQGLEGRLPASDRSGEEPVPDLISDDVFVGDGKIAQSRRSALQWLGRPDRSWMRYELGLVSFKGILDGMKASGVHGHLCEEVVTASSTTSSGATGQVTGSLAYKLAVRCGRHFGSEQGLRQHHSALHAPPGTWLCRTCGADCVTSQARTHHERSCGQPTAGVGENESTGAPSTGGPGPTKANKQHGPVGVVGKKKGPKTTQTTSEEKDPDGSIRVSGYRGVWVNQAGKHFVKITGERLKEDDDKDTLFAGVEEAAKKHDEVLESKNPEGKNEYNFKPDGSRIVYEDVSTSSTTGLGGGAASVVPALSVINIKDLPTDVKPLLRDPRQTSRTGGNSKRHVYAYRGVCRQARKGHDRWQSQISFMGVNHYLGTFDSEWDAAAIYAWAHLILYGEEATKQAQKEGEEAAAAYEKEKRDIAAGIIAPTPLKPEKKQKRKPGKKKGESKEDGTEDGGETDEKPAKKKRAAKDDAGGEKKRAKVVADKESLVPILARSAGKASALAPRQAFVGVSDIELVQGVSKRLAMARLLNYAVTEVPLPAPVPRNFRPCAPIGSTKPPPPGGAMLLGLSPSLFGWHTETCLACRYFDTDSDAKRAESALSMQYGEDGDNEGFRTLIQGTTTIMGCASYRTQRIYSSLGLGAPPIGGAVGAIDCHIGGSSKACSESAASIRYLPTPSGDYQFSAVLEDDVVTMNGQRITPGMGSFPLFNEDVCTVGPRVFVFLLPTDT